MAIQVRRGAYSDFDPTKMVPGEIADVQSGDPNTTDGKAVYLCFVAGTVKRIVLWDDLQSALAELQIDWNDISSKPTSFPTTWSQVTGRPVATDTGSGNIVITAG